jgi:hypothetical protein
VDSVEIVEEKKELCSIASKIVSVRIVRQIVKPTEEGRITGFSCADSSSTCESRCTYKMILEDFCRATSKSCLTQTQRDL